MLALVLALVLAPVLALVLAPALEPALAFRGGGIIAPAGSHKVVPVSPLRRAAACLLSFVPLAVWGQLVEGKGPDCPRLLATGQRWAWVGHPLDATRAVLVVDDGRVLPLVRDGATTAPRLAQPWPDADCIVHSLPSPNAELPLPAAAAQALVEGIGAMPAPEVAAQRRGGLAERAAAWRQLGERLDAALADRAASAEREPMVTALLMRLEAATQLAALAAGRIDIAPTALEQRRQALLARLGTQAHASVEALVEWVVALDLLDSQRQALDLLEAELPALVRALGATRRQTLRLEELRVRALVSARGATRALPAAQALQTGAREALPAADPLRADTELTLARVLVGAGQRAEAAALLEELAARLGSAPSQRAARVQDRMATAYLSTGRLSEGLLATQRAYLMALDLVGPEHPDGLRATNNFADNLRQLGDNEAALPLARRAHEGYKRLYGEGHRNALISARNVSLLLGELGQPQEALSFVQAQLAAAERRLGPDDAQVLNTRIHVVELLDLIGRHAEAVDVAVALVEPTERRFGAQGELSIVNQTLLAGAAAAAGQPERAGRALALASQRIERIEDQRRALGLLEVAARTAERVGDPHRHEALLARYVELAERADRSGLSEDAASWVQLFRAAPHLRWVVMRAERGEVDAAFDLSERFKGRVLLATLGQVAGDASPVLPEAVRAELAEARQRVRAAEAGFTAAGEGPARVLAGVRREEAAQAYLALRARVKREHPRFAAVADAPVLASADVPRQLASDTCMLSFVTGEAHAGVFVLARGQAIRWLALPSPKTIEPLVQRVREAWTSPSRGPTTSADAAAQTELARIVAPALAACPAKTRRLVLSPDGALALLPFEALAVGDRALVERYAVSYVQSFSVLALLRQRGAARGGAVRPGPLGPDRRGRPAPSRSTLLGVGAPSFAAGPQQPPPGLPEAALRTAAQNVAVARLGDDPQAARRAFDAMGMRWSALPGAEREVRDVGRMFAASRLLIGEQASEERVAALNASGELSRYRYLLFATHGFLSYTHPSLSAIVLRQPGTPGHDGYLTAAELPLYRLDSELVVLSACETGVGPVRAGTGVMGLPLALMAAGNRHAVVTLWAVPDRSASEVVTRLFRHLLRGSTPAEALARAKREVARQPQYANPLHWAAFVVYGAQ
ncbi:MAG: CHAT domain-containing protein [Rubrivivax sp.]|nr:CHAT domain-containing protein [Rubrivivax sp.]